jgi:hypothetical protein
MNTIFDIPSSFSLFHAAEGACSSFSEYFSSSEDNIVLSMDDVELLDDGEEDRFSTLIRKIEQEGNNRFQTFFCIAIC